MEKLELVLQLIGAIGVVCNIVSLLLPAGKARDVLSQLGFNLGNAVKAVRGK
jgi:hypothetical protein